MYSLDHLDKWTSRWSHSTLSMQNIFLEVRKLINPSERFLLPRVSPHITRSVIKHRYSYSEEFFLLIHECNYSFSKNWTNVRKEWSNFFNKSDWFREPVFLIDEVQKHYGRKRTKWWKKYIRNSFIVISWNVSNYDNKMRLSEASFKSMISLSN